MKKEEMTEIEKVTLALLYASGWEDEDRTDDKKVFRAWKGYLFDILNNLKEKGYINQFMNQMSVTITENGVDEAKKLYKEITTCINKK